MNIEDTPQKCSAVSSDDQPCRAWAVRGSRPALCSIHAGRSNRASGAGAAGREEDRALSREGWRALVRGWKGAASSVMWVLLGVEEGLTAVELERAAGYSDKPVRQALRDLEGMGLVVHDGNRRGWRVRKGMRVEILIMLIEKSVTS